MPRVRVRSRSTSKPKSSKSEAKAMYEKGTRAFDNGNYRYAANCFVVARRMYRELDIENIKVSTALAAAYEQLGKLSEAKDCIQEYLENCQGEMTLDSFSLLKDMAHLYSSSGQYEEAESTYLEVLESCFEYLISNPTDSENCQNLIVETYEEKAQLHCRLGQLKQEVHCRKEIVKYRPGVKERLDLAQVYFSYGKVEKSLAICEELAKQHPDHIEILLLQAQIMNDREKDDLGYKFCEKALLHRPKCKSLKSAILFVQALCLIKDPKTHEKAETLFRKSLRAQPTVECYNELAILLCSQKRYAEALTEAQQAKRLAIKENDSRLASIVHTLAEVSLGMKEYEDALGWFKEVRRIDPEFKDIDKQIQKIKLMIEEESESGLESDEADMQQQETPTRGQQATPNESIDSASYFIEKPSILTTLPSCLTSWSMDHVALFLRSNKFGQYEQQFRFHRIDGQALAHLNEQHMMTHLGIQHLGDVLILKHLIDEWKETVAKVEPEVIILD